MRWNLMLLLFLAGCTAQSGVIADGPDAYRIMITGKSGFTASGKLKIEAYQEAAEYCSKMRKRMEKVEENTVENGFLRYPSTDLRFKCI